MSEDSLPLEAAARRIGISSGELRTLRDHAFYEGWSERKVPMSAVRFLERAKTSGFNPYLSPGTAFIWQLGGEVPGQIPLPWFEQDRGATDRSAIELLDELADDAGMRPREEHERWAGFPQISDQNMDRLLEDGIVVATLAGYVVAAARVVAELPDVDDQVRIRVPGFERIPSRGRALLVEPMPDQERQLAIGSYYRLAHGKRHEVIDMREHEAAGSGVTELAAIRVTLKDGQIDADLDLFGVTSSVIVRKVLERIESLIDDTRSDPYFL